MPERRRIRPGLRRTKTNPYFKKGRLMSEYGIRPFDFPDMQRLIFSSVFIVKKITASRENLRSKLLKDASNVY